MCITFKYMLINTVVQTCARAPCVNMRRENKHISVQIIFVSRWLEEHAHPQKKELHRDTRTNCWSNCFIRINSSAHKRMRFIQLYGTLSRAHRRHIRNLHIFFYACASFHFGRVGRSVFLCFWVRVWVSHFLYDNVPSSDNNARTGKGIKFHIGVL